VTSNEQTDTLEPQNGVSTAPTSPADVASAARSCSAIILVLVGIVMLLCIAFVISQLM